ncbi:MAG: DUF11 domain-containing protein [Chloroflexi bacterium]|nr:DUF11 domain-containing protein [Chloroflexota bacterium]
MTVLSSSAAARQHGRLPTANWMSLPALLLLAILPALPAFAGPGSGWVKADVVSGGCVQQGNVTVCSSEVTPGSPTLYEYKPDRQSVGRNYSQSPSLASHGGYPTYEPRDACIVNGRFMYWPAGVWHHGGRWTLEIRNGAQHWIGPSSEHWAFEHNDVCRAEGPNAVTPTIGGGGGVPGTPVSGPPPTVPPILIPPTSFVLPTPPPCYDSDVIPFGPMPLTVQAFMGGAWQVPGWPYLRTGSHASEMQGGAVAPAVPPAPYPQIAAGVEMRAVFEVGLTRMTNNQPVDYGLVGGPQSSRREFMLALQDLGADGAPGGGGANADTLLTWLNGSAEGDPRVMRVARDWIKTDYFGDGIPANGPVDYPGNIGGFGLGGGAWSTASVMFESRTGSTYGQRASTPDLGPGERWWIVDSRDGANSYSVRFVTQPNRVYRLVGTVGREACGRWYYNSSQLLFSTFPVVQPNLGLTKSAPDIALRGETIEYTLFYQNASPGTVTGATLTDDLPASVTYVSASPAPAGISGRRLSWNLGDVPAGTSGTITVRATVNGNAPASLVNVADITATNDSDPRDNHAEATTSVPQGNVTVTASAPRTVEPGQSIDLTIGYRNTTGYPVRFTTLKNLLPPGITLLSSSRAPALNEDAGGQQRVTWDLGTVPAGASATITLRIRVEDAAPNVLRNVVWIESPEDANQLDNEAETSTVVLRAPPPQATFRLRIHSSLDPNDGVYLTSGSAFRWPAGEVLDFAPFIELQPPAQPPEGFYRLTQQVVAWSFVRSGGLQPGGAGCKARTTPTAGEIANADLSALQGCVYRYLANPSAAEMAGMGHLYWAATPPERMRADVYMLTPLPAGPTDLAIQIAVLSTLSENGSYDLNGDGSATSVLLYRTHTVTGGFTPTLLVPRDAR